MDRKGLEAGAWKLNAEWGNKPGIDREKLVSALADWAERIQQEDRAEIERLREVL
jgi:hypothetical protein